MMALPASLGFTARPAGGGGGGGGLQLVGFATGTAVGSASYAVSLTALTGGIGSAPIEGDLVIVTSGWGGSSAPDGNPGVSTSGYTEVADLYSNDSSDSNMAVSWKLMAASPDTSVTVTGYTGGLSACGALVEVWRGADLASPFSVAAVTATGIDGSRADAPAITPVHSGSVVLALSLSSGDSSPAAFTGPAGMSGFTQLNGVSSVSAILTRAHVAWASGTYDPAPLTGGESASSQSWCATTLALRPA